MPANKRPRKHYRPKNVLRDPVSWVRKGFMQLTDYGHHAVNLKIRAHDSLNNICSGKGRFEDVDSLVNALNISDALATGGEIGSEYVPVIRAGQDALFTMASRGKASDRFLFTGPEITAVQLALEVHDAQLDVCTVDDLETALRCVVHLIRNKRGRAII